MRILAVFPLALGLAAAAAVSTAGAAACSAAAAAGSADIVNPENDVQFKKLSADERAQLIEELQAGGMVKRKVGSAVSPTLTEETGEADDEEGLEEFVPEEQQEVEAEDGFRELSRRDLEGESVEQTEAGADEAEAPDADEDGAEAADDSTEGQGDEAEGDDEEEELDSTAAENVQNALNDPEVQAYVSNGDWDDSNEADEELAVSPDAAADADADSDSNADEATVDIDKTSTDGTILSRRKEATAKTQPKSNNVHLKVCPPCMKNKNPPLQCRIMSARRHWCKENKQTCKEKHTWLHRALFINKPKTATQSKNAGKPKQKDGKVSAQSYQPAKDATPPSYGASTPSKHQGQGKKNKHTKANAYPAHAGTINPGKPATYPVTKKHNQHPKHAGGSKHPKHTAQPASYAGTNKHPKHRAGKGKTPKHPKHPEPNQAPAYGAAPNAGSNAGANAGKPKPRPSAYVPIPQGGIPKHATQPAYSTAPVGKGQGGKHNAGKGKGGKGKTTTTTVAAGAAQYTTAPASKAPVYGAAQPPKYSKTSTVVVTPTSYLVAGTSAPSAPSYVRRDLGDEEEEEEDEGGEESDFDDGEDGEEDDESEEEDSATESDGGDDEDEDDEEDMADRLARRDIALGPHVSLRPKCMGK